MQKISNFEHLPGFQCGSTSVRSMLHFFGFDVSEPMAMGMGQILFLAYAINPDFSPTRLVLTRSADYEIVAFKGFGFGVNLRQTDDPIQAWRWLQDELDADRPAMLQVDLAQLPYYKTTTPFPGHKTIVFGYDLEKGTVLVSDNEFEQPQVLTMEQLEKARTSDLPLFDLRYNWFELSPPKKLIPFETSLPRALKGQAKALQSDATFFGLHNLDHLAKTISDWGEAQDWRWCARFTYQVIEKRGTGGGAFRLKYADFLREATAFCPKIESAGLVSLLQKTAATWTELGAVMRAICDREMPGGFDKAALIVAEIASLERNFCKIVEEIF